MSRSVKWLPIPAKTQRSKCRFCPEMIYWAPHPSTQNSHPISVQVDGSEPPTADTEGRGVSHFSNCPGADRARRTS